MLQKSVIHHFPFHLTIYKRYSPISTHAALLLFFCIVFLHMDVLLFIRQPSVDQLHCFHYKN